MTEQASRQRDFDPAHPFLKVQWVYDAIGSPGHRLEGLTGSPDGGQKEADRGQALSSVVGGLPVCRSGQAHRS